MRRALGCALWALGALAAGCAAPQPACADRGVDQVAGHVDGDTLDGAACGRIRLALVDAPERGEDGFDEASGFAAATCPLGSAMAVDLDDGQPLDTTGTRRVAVVTCGGVNLNAALLEAGHAVLLVEFCGRSEFAQDAWARDACAQG